MQDQYGMRVGGDQPTIPRLLGLGFKDLPHESGHINGNAGWQIS